MTRLCLGQARKAINSAFHVALNASPETTASSTALARNCLPPNCSLATAFVLQLFDT
jgi:hypothetical protein